MFIAVQLGLLWLAFYLLCLGTFAAAITLRLGQDAEPEEAAVDVMTLVCACQGVMTVALGLASRLGRVEFTVVGVVLAGLGYRLEGRRALTSLLRWYGQTAARFMRSPALLLVTAVGLLTVARGLSIPQATWDGLSYHLTYPATWIREGSIVRFEAGGVWEAYETFPKGAESLFYLGMLPFGRDYTVNLVNLPFWFGIAVGAGSILRRLDVPQRGADVATAVLVLSPALSNYITPAYNEVPKAFALVAALSAGARALVGRDTRALVPLGIALGVGLSIKFTTLTWCGGATLAALWMMRTRVQPALRHTLVGAGCTLAVCGLWYAHNAYRCEGNLLYPAPLSGSASGALAGSAELAWQLQNTSVVAQGVVDHIIAYLAVPPWEVGYPMGPGVLFLAVLVASPLLTAATSRRPASLTLLAATLGLTVVYLVTPYNGLYMPSGTRFLGPPLVTGVLCCAVAASGLPPVVGRALGAVGVGLAVVALTRISTIAEFFASWQSIAIAALLGVACLAVARVVVPGRRRAVAAMAVVASMALLPGALAFREDHRFDRIDDLHPIRGWAGWAEVARLPPSHIAFAAGGIAGTEGWFFYPLFGPDLRHRVSYVDVERDAESRACHRRGRIRDEPDLRAWLARLDEREVDYLFTSGSSLERDWASSLPERFELVLDEGDARLHRVVRE